MSQLLGHLSPFLRLTGWGQCYAIVGKVTAGNAGTPHGHWFKFQLLHF